MSNNGGLRFLLRLSGSENIARRYFVTNGFDGTLAMLGLIMGFRTMERAPVSVAIIACLGTAVALGVSGISSAYISEAAERKQELGTLREAMLDGLDESAHARAAKWVPVVIALVNGVAPFALAQLVMLPLWLEWFGIHLPVSPFDTAIIIALFLIFLFGVFLGNVGGRFWLWAGLRTLGIGIVTLAIIWLLTP